MVFAGFSLGWVGVTRDRLDALEHGYGFAPDRIRVCENEADRYNLAWICVQSSVCDKKLIEVLSWAKDHFSLWLAKRFLCWIEREEKNLSIAGINPQVLVRG